MKSIVYGVRLPLSYKHLHTDSKRHTDFVLYVDYKPDPPENPVSHYLELKTSRSLINPRQIKTFESQKLLKFWAQSFLLGIPRIIVGFRSDTNVLLSTQTLETMAIPAQVRERGGPGVWDGNVCINFAARFLEVLRAGMEEGALMGIRFQKGGAAVEVFRKEGGTFLTKEFIKWKDQVRNSEGK